MKDETKKRGSFFFVGGFLGADEKKVVQFERFFRMFTLKSGEDEPILRRIDFFRWGGKQPATRMSRNMKEERIASPKWENLCPPKTWIFN